MMALVSGFFPVWVVGSGYSSFPQDQHVDPDDCVTLDLEFKKTQDFGACYSAFVHSGRFQRINDAAHHAMEDSNSSFTFLGTDSSQDYSAPLKLRILHYYHKEGFLDKKNFPLAQHISITVIKNQEEIQDPVPLMPIDAGYTHGPIPKLRDLEYLDNLWCPFEYRMQIPLDQPTGNTNLQVRVCRESAYWNNTQADGMDYMADTGLGIEYDNAGIPTTYTLFANAYESRYKRIDITETGTPIANGRISLVPNSAAVFTEVSNSPSFLGKVSTSTIKPLELSVQTVSDFTDPTNGRTPTLKSLIITPRSSSGAFVPPSGNLRRFASGFTSVCFTKEEWDALEAAYAANFLDGSGNKLVSNSRVYMSFQNDGVHNDANNNQFVRFKVLLRGFVINGSDVQLLDVHPSITAGPMYHYIAYESHNASQNDKISALAAANEAGSGHKVNFGYRNIPYTAPNETITSFPRADIDAHFHFARGIGMTWLDLKNMCEAVEENIKNVWDSSHNGGMWEITDPDPLLGPVNGNMPAPYTPAEIENYWSNTPPDMKFLRIRADKITCSVACPGHYAYVDPAHSLITVNRTISSLRSFVTSRRTGMFYCEYASGMENDPSRNKNDIQGGSTNTFAHEFGHLMGLEDRYCFYGREYLNGGRHTVAPEGGHAVAAVYIEDSVDTHYHNNYRWRYNLMNFAEGVPKAPADLADSNFVESGSFNLEPMFAAEYNNYCEDNFLANTPNGRMFVFITEKQWLHVKNYTDEDGFFGGAALFFKHLASPTSPNVNNQFDRSFVGFQHNSTSVPDDCALIVTDDKLQVGSGVSITDMANRASSAREPGNTINFWGWVQGNSLIELNRSPVRIQDAVTGGASASVAQRIGATEINDILDDDPLFTLDLSSRPFPLSGGATYPSFYDYYDADTDTVRLIGGPKAPCTTPNPSIHVSGPDPVDDRGIDLWESHTETGLPGYTVTGYPPFGTVEVPNIVRYNDHFNREEIIKTIGGLDAG